MHTTPLRLALALVLAAPASMLAPPGAAACGPDAPLACAPPSVPECELVTAAWLRWEPDRAPGTEGSEWVRGVAAFAAAGWTEVPHVTCGAQPAPAWTRDGPGACLVETARHTTDMCAILTFHARAVAAGAEVARTDDATLC